MSAPRSATCGTHIEALDRRASSLFKWSPGPAGDGDGDVPSSRNPAPDVPRRTSASIRSWRCLYERAYRFVARDRGACRARRRRRPLARADDRRTARRGDHGSTRAWPFTGRQLAANASCHSAAGSVAVVQAYEDPTTGRSRAEIRSPAASRRPPGQGQATRSTGSVVRYYGSRFSREQAA